MGLVQRLLATLFGGGRNVVTETAGAFLENAEAGAQRQAELTGGAMAQLSSEFRTRNRCWFDRFMDGLNRLPRPFMVIATFGLFASAMIDPIWFAERMQGLVLVPEPLWWLAGTIVAFYFGGRFQVKGHEFRQSAAQAATLVPTVLQNISRLRALRHDSPGVAGTGTDVVLEASATEAGENDAVKDWREGPNV